MKELDSFTVERLEEIIAEEGYSAMRSPKNDEVLALAAIALAAKRAEPVDEITFDMARGIMALVNETNIGGAVQLQAKIQCFIEEALTTTPQLNSPQGWIKCSDHRPERGTDVQVYCSDTREQFVAFYIGNGEFQYAQHEDISIACRPSHWMPLQPAPEKP
ncbi:TPA: DUF551 domain-containing protein [Yersinia enterocolitica]